VYFRDAATGALTFVEAETGGGIQTPYGVVVSPDNKHVYVSDFGYPFGGASGDGGVFTYSRDATTGGRTYVENDYCGKMGGAELLAISPDGKHVYVPGYVDDSITTFSRNATSGALTFVEVDTDGVGGANGLSSPNAVAVSTGGGANVYVASEGDSAVATFSRNSTTGALTYQELDSPAALDGVEDVDVSPDNGNVYAVSFFGDSIATFSRNSTTGALAFLEADENSDPGVDMFNGAWGLDVSPDGENVYVAALADGAVATFERNAPPFALSLSAKARQRVGALKARARCSIGCYLVAHATAKVGHSKFESKKVKETFPAGEKETLELKFSSRALRAIRRGLKRHSGTATIRANGSAVDEKKSKEVKVRLRR